MAAPFISLEYWNLLIHRLGVDYVFLLCDQLYYMEGYHRGPGTDMV